MLKTALLTKRTEVVEAVSAIASLEAEIHAIENFSASNASGEVLFIVDDEQLQAVGSGERDAILAYPAIVLIDRNLPDDVRQTYRQSVMFYIDRDDPLNLENLVTLIKTTAEKLVLDSRLNSYIQDAFRDIVDSTLLQKQKQEIEELNRQLEMLSRVDFLTHLLNRRALMEAFDQEKRRAIRHRWRLKRSGNLEPSSDGTTDESDFEHDPEDSLDEHFGNFACLIIDIDHFKLVNDTYGHLTGDAVLAKIGEILNTPGLFRETDVKGRYGGEEFIVLLSETNADHALIPARRLMKQFRKTSFPTATAAPSP